MSSISEMHYKARECGYYLIKHRLSVYGLSSCDSPIFGLDPFGGHRLRRLCHLSESVFEADRARSGFAIAENCSPQRVVVVDDVYTTGAGINSAAVALAGGGHDVCGAFVTACRVNPDYHRAAGW